MQHRMKNAIIIDANIPPTAPPMAPAMAPLRGDSLSQYYLNSSQFPFSDIVFFFFKLSILRFLYKNIKNVKSSAAYYCLLNDFVL